jgi:uncharacterized protein YbjT (DUF2867 family)
MKIALTGSAGFIGSHISTERRAHGHEVTALVRDDAQSANVAGQGGTPEVVDLYDRPVLVKLLGEADGAIHTASAGNDTGADLDTAVVDAAIAAFVSVIMAGLTLVAEDEKLLALSDRIFDDLYEFLRDALLQGHDPA